MESETIFLLCELWEYLESIEREIYSGFRCAIVNLINCGFSVYFIWVEVKKKVTCKPPYLIYSRVPFIFFSLHFNKFPKNSPVSDDT